MRAFDNGGNVSRPDSGYNDAHLDADSSLSTQVLGFFPNFLSELSIGFGFKQVKLKRVR